MGTVIDVMNMPANFGLLIDRLSLESRRKVSEWAAVLVDAEYDETSSEVGAALGGDDGGTTSSLRTVPASGPTDT